MNELHIPAMKPAVISLDYWLMGVVSSNFKVPSNTVNYNTVTIPANA